MFKVTTIEKWKDQLTATVYTFKELSHFNMFIEMCRDDGVFIIINGKSNSSRSA